MLRESIVPNIDKVFREDAGSYGQMRWRRVRFLSEQFWARWKSDYLSNLQSRNKWRKPSTDLRVDDVVLLKEVSPRCLWPMGRVVEAFPDQDGRVRKVELVCAISKGGKPKIFQRIIHQLVKLMWFPHFSFCPWCRFSCNKLSFQKAEDTASRPQSPQDASLARSRGSLDPSIAR